MDYDGKDYALTPEGLEDFQRDAQDFMNRVEGGDVLNYEMLQLQKKMLLSLVPLLFILQ